MNRLKLKLNLRALAARWMHSDRHTYTAQVMPGTGINISLAMGGGGAEKLNSY